MLGRLVARRGEPLSRTEERLAWTTTILLTASLFLPFAARYVLLGVINLPKMEGFAATIGMSPTNAAGVLAVAILFLAARPSWTTLKVWLPIALVCEGLYLHNLPDVLTTFQTLLSAGGGIGLAGLAALAYQSFLDPVPEARARARIFLKMGIILVLFPLTMGGLLGALSNFTREVWDGYGFIVEGCLGFYPSFEVAGFLAENQSIQGLFHAVYSRLPIIVIVALVLTLHLTTKCHFDLFQAYILSGILVFPFYLMLPMIGIDYFLGPKYYPLGEIPDYTIPKTVLADPRLPRSCIPSIHTSSILMAYWSVKRISPLLSYLYLSLTVATLVSALDPRVGHYVIDFVGAFPFTLGCVALACQPSESRPRSLIWQCAAIGFFLTALVSLSIRWYATTLAEYPVLTWLGFAAIVAVSIWQESRLWTSWSPAPKGSLETAEEAA